MVRLRWLFLLFLAACSKTNKVEIDTPKEQPETCLSACQRAFALGQAGAAPWCGLPVPAAGQKGSDMTACQGDCSARSTAQPVLNCVVSADDCQELGGCGFLQKGP
jgi:hypothetical protein